MFERRGGKRGQVTIFIIIGVIIIAGVILIASFYPQIRTALTGEEQTPQSFIQTCVEQEIENSIEKISQQGGSINPEYYTLKSGTKIQYLCYTNENYKLGSLQKPGLQNVIETEIEKNIEDTVKSCFDSLKESYDKKGYSVEITEGEITTELFSEKVVSTFDYAVTLAKGEDTQEYESFVVAVNSNLYELSAIANSIARIESEAGNIEPAGYMTIYPYLKVYKTGTDDGTKIYDLTHKKTGDRFQFASRSLVFPSGYI